MDFILYFMQKFSYEIALAVKGSAISAFFLMLLLFFGFNVLEASIEKLIWGKAFLHWLDPLFVGLWLWFTILVILQCKNVH